MPSAPANESVMSDANHISFPYSDEQFQTVIQEAVEHYWSVRLGQAKRQRRRGRRDTGTRGEVTGGKQFDAFSSLLQRLANKAGFSDNELFFGGNELPVPGYYRPQKKWDFAVVRDCRLVAAAEFKSQIGSLGNNCNNRIEEVIGLARDFWVSYREKVFGLVPKPWLGYLFLLEESADSEHPVGLIPSPLAPLGKFDRASYRDRYRILCETLVLERDFSATALLSSPRPENAEATSFSNPLPEWSALAFCRSFFAHLVVAANA